MEQVADAHSELLAAVRDQILTVLAHGSITCANVLPHWEYAWPETREVASLAVEVHCEASLHRSVEKYDSRQPSPLNKQRKSGWCSTRSYRKCCVFRAGVWFVQLDKALKFNQFQRVDTDREWECGEFYHHLWPSA